VKPAAGLIALTLMSLAGCSTRWRPESAPGLLQLTEACLGHIGPLVEDFGEGRRAVYTIVVKGASERALRAFDQRMAQQGFASFGSITMIDSRVLFIRSQRMLRSQAESDAEFAAVCRLEREPIYLTHVRYNGPADEVDGGVRVR